MIGLTSAYFIKNYEYDKINIPKKDLNNIWNFAQPDIKLLKSGDLILRHGRGFISNAFMSLSFKEKKYSHCGIVHIENGNVYVYHVIGGEENVNNKMRKDLLKDFCDPRRVHSFGIFRYNLDEKQLNQFDSLSIDYYHKGLQFDTKLDLATDDVMYCSELVYKILQKVTCDKNYIATSSVNGYKYVAIDNLYLNNHCIPVYEYSFK
jgi:hypothetical protein